ncbi:uncharacterized protein LOC132695689 [Cylas formicarius]|uniref:uncharacterized protein LOC132695689 n=1 Tax=Cylas formicarius TaxID=197179 RepID=UPI00295899F5|nr:uncharacterized protein LOC132695689 [Cylas formicarius]
MIYISYCLVYLTLLSAQCHSQSEDGRRYIPGPSRYNTDVQEEQESYRQERQSPVYKVSRQDDKLQASIQYFEPQADYQVESEYLPTNYEQISKSRFSRVRLQPKQQPIVEQYLKEVTPTTKTVYNPKIYVRYQQPSSTADTRDTISKQSPYQYASQSQSQHTPEIQLPEPPKKPSGHLAKGNILAYQNALIAHQNALYEQQRAADLIKQQNSPSKSAIYIAQKIQQRPAVKELPKPVQASNEDEVNYYIKLQEYQQQKRAETYEQAAPVKYQARAPEVQEVVEDQIYQSQIVPYQDLRSAVPKFTPVQPEYLQEVRYQSYQPTEQDRYQNVQPGYYEYQQVPVKASEEQYQQHFRGGPKYLPEAKLVSYQQAEGAGNKHYQPGRAAYDKYRAEIAKYHGKSEQSPQKSQSEEPDDDGELIKTLGKNTSLRLYKGQPTVFIGRED